MRKKAHTPQSQYSKQRHFSKEDTYKKKIHQRIFKFIQHNIGSPGWC